MDSLCSHNLTIGIYSFRGSPLIDIDEARNRVIGVIGRFYDRALAPPNGPR